MTFSNLRNGMFLSSSVVARPQARHCVVPLHRNKHREWEKSRNGELGRVKQGCKDLLPGRFGRGYRCACPPGLRTLSWAFASGASQPRQFMCRPVGPVACRPAEPVDGQWGFRAGGPVHSLPGSSGPGLHANETTSPEGATQDAAKSENWQNPMDASYSIAVGMCRPAGA
jgi:hypothetical protein